jgi:S-adenosylmethionine uptake transporter
MALCIKAATEHGASVAQVMLWRGGISALASWLWLCLLRQPLATRHGSAHVRRGVVAFVSMLGYVYAISLLPIATAVTLNNTAPLWLALILTLWHREPLSLRLVFATLAGFAGVALLLRPSLRGTELLAFAVGLATGLTAAVGTLNVRVLGRLDEHPVRTVFYFAVFVTVASLPGALLDPRLPTSGASLAYLTAAGLFATVAQWMFTLAMRQGHAQLNAVLGYLLVVLTSLAGVFWWGNHLTVPAWAGMALIIASGIAVTALLLPTAKPADA